MVTFSDVSSYAGTQNRTFLDRPRSALGPLPTRTPLMYTLVYLPSAMMRAWTTVFWKSPLAGPFASTFPV